MKLCYIQRNSAMFNHGWAFCKNMFEFSHQREIHVVWHVRRCDGRAIISTINPYFSIMIVIY